jgi:uncharacterized membrane-anchored protein YhcB (DUF1043 family)
MQPSPEFTILYGLVACIAIYLLFKYVTKITMRQKKQIVLERIKALRLESVTLQKEINTYILSQNAEHQTTPTGITVGQFYRQLKYNHCAHLSSKLIEKLQNSDNPLLIKKTLEELDPQKEKLKEARALFEEMQHYKVTV